VTGSTDSLREQAYVLIRDRILTYAYQPGDLLSESRVADDLAMSRTPVRAALEALQSDGLVRRHPRTGFAVEVITPQTISDVFFVRIALECHAVRHLNPHDAAARWEKFVTLFELFRGDHDQPIGDDWLLVQEADRLFHRELFVRTGNRVALQIADRVELRFARFRAMAWDRSERYRVGAHDHLEIVRAITAGDLDEAATMLEQHLLSGRDHLISLMSKPPGPVSLSLVAPTAGRLSLWLDGEGPFPTSEHLSLPENGDTVVEPAEQPAAHGVETTS
jgi:DNA-binding GntR family transcriptional regulator